MRSSDMYPDKGQKLIWDGLYEGGEKEFLQGAGKDHGGIRLGTESCQGEMWEKKREKAIRPDLAALGEKGAGVSAFSRARSVFAFDRR